MSRSSAVPPEDAWRTRVTEEDIRTARTAWWDARRSGESPYRVAELWDDLVRLFRAEAAQIAGRYADRGGRGDADVPGPRGESVPG